MFVSNLIHIGNKRKLLFLKNAFSSVEVMVTLMVLSVGFLAMAGLMMQITAQQSRNETYNNLRELAKAKLSQITHVDFSLLGTGSTADEQKLWGAPGEVIVTSSSLNKAGEVYDGSNFGPFKYTLNFVVCLELI